MKIHITNLPKNNSLTFEYAFYSSHAGKLLVASWQQALVFVALVSTEKQALQAMKARFPEARCIKKEVPVHKKVLKYLRAPKKFQSSLVVATSGTPFQKRVWRALGRVPFGQTCFYSDLAKAIKQPSAVRAVASVVAKNPIAILIPCHRVLPRSGGVGNYHWGVKNKSALLTWERLLA